MSGVLELLNYAAPYAGNFLSSIRALADALRGRGAETVLVFPESARSRAWAPALERDFPVYYLPHGTAKAAGLLRRVIRKHDVKCVHSHFTDSHFYLPLRIALLGKPIPHVYHAHSLPHFSRGSMALRRRIIHADRILCVSETVQSAYLAAGFSGCVLVPNGVDLERLQQTQTIRCPHPFVLLFGYDFRIKGIDVALDAFGRYDPEHRFTLGICVAGHGDQAREALCARFGAVPEWVQLLPPREDVGTYYRAADVFLSASRTEGMPYAVLEGAYCGLPLALSDIPQHRQLGLPRAEWFPTEDAQALFDCVCRAVQTTETAQNAAYVAEKFSLQTWTQNVLLQLFPKKERQL